MTPVYPLTPADEAAFWASEVPAMLDAWADPASATDEIVALLVNEIGPLCAGDRVLDLGCGAGRLAFPFAAAHPGVQVVGVDSCPEMLAEARRRRTALEPAACLPVFMPGNGRTLPLSGTSLAGAYCITVMQHAPAAICASYVAQVADRLVPGGQFVYQVVAGEDVATGPFMFGHSPLTAIEWAVEAGLELDADPRLRGAVFPEWFWVIAVRP